MKTILLLDDEVSLMKLMSHVLVRRGFVVWESSNAEEAIARFLDVKGQIDILVEMSDVDVDKNKVCIENRPVRFIMKIDIEHLTVAAPVPAEVEQYAPVGRSRGLERCRNVGSRLCRVWINITACGICGAGCKCQHDSRANPGSNPFECLHEMAISSIGHLSVCHKR